MTRFATIAVRSGLGALAAIALMSLLSGEDVLAVVPTVAAADADAEPLEPPAGQVFHAGGRMDSFAFDREG